MSYLIHGWSRISWICGVVPQRERGCWSNIWQSESQPTNWTWLAHGQGYLGPALNSSLPCLFLSHLRLSCVYVLDIGHVDVCVSRSNLVLESYYNSFDNFLQTTAFCKAMQLEWLKHTTSSSDQMFKYINNIHMLMYIQRLTGHFTFSLRTYWPPGNPWLTQSNVRH